MRNRMPHPAASATTVADAHRSLNPQSSRVGIRDSERMMFIANIVISNATSIDDDWSRRSSAAPTQLSIGQPHSCPTSPRDGPG